MAEVIQVTHFKCEADSMKRTHHLVPRAGSQTCKYCGHTEKQLRARYLKEARDA